MPSKREIELIKDISQSTVNATKSAVSGFKRMLPKSKPKKSSDDSSSSSQNNVLAMILGALAGEPIDKIEKAKPVSKDQGIFGKISIISDYIEELKKEQEGGEDEGNEEESSFYQKLTEFIQGEGAQQFSNDFCKLIAGVDKIVEFIGEAGEDEGEDEGEGEKLTVTVEGGGGDALSNLVETIKDNPNVAEDATKSLEGVGDVAKAAEKAIEEMDKASQNPDIVDKYKDTMKKMEEANDATKTVTDKADPKEAAKQAESLSDIGEVMIGVAALSLILVGVGLLADKLDFGAMMKFAVALGAFLLAIGLSLKIAWENMKVDQQGVKAALMLIAGASLIMLLGSMIIEYVDTANLVLFTATLGGFLWAIGKVLKKVGRHFASMTKNIIFALALVGGAALIMFLGAAIVPLVDIGALLKFTALLGGFLWAIGKVLKRVGRHFFSMTKNVVFALALVGGAALIMFLGAAIMPLVDIGALALFTLTLGAFLTAIGIVLKFVGKFYNRIKKEALLALALVAGAALIMFLGGSVMELVDVGQIALFTLTLGAFLFAIGGIFKIVGPWLSTAKREAINAVVVAGLAGMILLIGGLTMKFIKPADITLFTVLLAGLLIGLGIAFRLVKNVSDMVVKATAMLLVTTIGGLIIMAGGMILAKHPELITNVPIFVGLLAIAVGGVALILFGLSYISEFIAAGEMLLLSIAVSMMAAAAAFFIVNLVMAQAGGPGALLLSITTFMGILAIVTGMFGIMALASVAVEVGSTALLTMALSLVAAAGALVIVSMAMEKLAQVPEINSKILITNSLTILAMAGALTPIVFMSGPLMMVSGVLMLLSKAIGAIAESVANAASLKIACGWDERGRPNKFVQLSEKDFENAGKNIGLLVSTITNAIMKVYDEHPTWYSGGILSSSPLEKVIKQSSKLEELISAIAQGLKGYADLKFPIDWNENGRPTKFKVFTNNDFRNAANNIKYVVTTLTTAIMELYEEHPDWYDDNWGFTKSPLVKVINQSSKLQKLISAIAEGLRDYADLKFPIDWNENGKAIKFKLFENNDFVNASNNIKLVVTTLTNALMELYEEHPDWYDSGWFTDSPLVKVIKQSSKLQQLISSIAEGLRDYADLKFPIDWNENGKAIKFKTFTNEDFGNAAENIKNVVSTLSLALMDLYDTHPDWYDSGWFTDSPLVKVIKQSTKLQELLSGIAQGVSAWGNMMIPDDWNEQGKPTHYEKMTEEAKVAAGVNVVSIVSVMGDSLMKLYDDHNEWFAEEGGLFGFGASSKFEKVIGTVLKLSDLMSGIAQGVKDWSNLMIPDQWTDAGKPKHWVKIQQTDIDLVKDNIGLVINAVADALMDVYDKGNKKNMWDDNSIFGKIGFSSPGNTPFGKVIKTTLKLSDLMSGLAAGLQAWANLKIPKKWNEAGRPIDFDQMDKTKIVEAKDNINLIISELGSAIMQSYTDHDDWYNDTSIFGKIGIDIGNTPFSKAVNANLRLGELLKNISEGIQAYASLKMPEGFDKDGKPTGYKKIGQEEFQAASTNIGLVISTLGKAILDTYNKHEDWFMNTSLWGFIAGGADDTPMMRALTSSAKLGEVLKNIAEGLQAYAQLQFASKWNEKGEPIEFKKLSGPDFTLAGENIGKVVTALGESLINIYNQHPDWFDIKVNDKGEIEGGNPKFKLVFDSVSSLGDLVKSTAEGISSYASMEFAGINENMSAEEKTKLVDSTFEEASKNIGKVTITLATAVMAIANDPTYSGWFKEIASVETDVGFFSSTTKVNHTGNTPFGLVVGSLSKLGTLIADISTGISMYASQTIPGADGKPIPINDQTYTDAANTIKTVISTLGKAVIEIYNEGKADHMFDAEDLNSKSPKTPFQKTVYSISSLGKVISTIAEGLAHYAAQAIPIEWDENGKPTKFQSLTNTELEKASTSIGSIISTIGKAIVDTYTLNPQAFTTDYRGNSPAATVVKSLNMISGFVGKIADSVAVYASEKVYIWDGGHDEDGFKTYKEQKLTSSDIITAKQHISEIILAIAETITKTYKQNQTIFNTNGNNSPAQKIAKSMNIMGPAVEQSAKYLGNFVRTFSSFGLDSVNIPQVGNDMANILYEISKIYILLASDDDDDYEDWGIWTGKQYDDTFSKLLNDKDMIGAMRRAPKLLGAALNSLQFSIDQLSNFMMSNLKSIVTFNSLVGDLNSAITGIAKTIGLISTSTKMLKELNEGEKGGGILSMFGINNSKSIPLTEFIKTAPEIKQNIHIALDVFSSFVDSMANQMIPKLNQIEGIGENGKVFDPLMELIFTFRYAVQALGSNFEDLGSPFSSLNIFKNISDVDIDPSSFLSNITVLSKALTILANTSQIVNNASGKGFSVLSSGIASIATATSKVKNTKEFAAQTVQLEKYVKAINSAKLSNLKELFKFVNALNRLAARMGNLDNLTKAISDKLAVELKHLTEQLQSAQKTIDKADKMQDKRKRQIDTAVKNIERLMKQHMIVDVQVEKTK